MTSKRESNPLRRWAPVSPHQLPDCEALAPVIANADKLPLRTVIEAVIAFSDGWWRATKGAHARTPEAVIIEDLSYRKALSDQLRLLKYPSPDETPRRIVKLATVLHQFPVTKYQLPSTLLALAETYSEQVKFAHLTRLAPVLMTYYDDVPFERTYAFNRELVGDALRMVVAYNLTAKQLEVQTNKALGVTPPGRPRKDAKPS